MPNWFTWWDYSYQLFLGHLLVVGSVHVYIHTYFYIRMCPLAIDAQQAYTEDVHCSSHWMNEWHSQWMSLYQCISSSCFYRAHLIKEIMLAIYSVLCVLDCITPIERHGNIIFFWTSKANSNFCSSCSLLLSLQSFIYLFDFHLIIEQRRT